MNTVSAARSCEVLVVAYLRGYVGGRFFTSDVAEATKLTTGQVFPILTRMKHRGHMSAIKRGRDVIWRVTEAILEGTQ